MRIHVVVFMRKTEKFYDNAAAEYEKRLGRYCKIRITRLSPGSSCPQPEGCCVVIRPGGAMISSEELAEKIERAQVRGVSRMTVLLPFSEEDPSEGWEPAPVRLALSSMEMSPGLTLTVLLEQIYRAYKIIHGEMYHK